MNTSRQWLYFTLIRLGLFGVALAVLLLLKVNPYAATLVAAVVGFCLSYLFLRRRRDALAMSIHRLRNDDRHVVQRDRDNDIENAALDRLDQDDHDGKP